MPGAGLALYTFNGGGTDPRRVRIWTRTAGKLVAMAAPSGHVLICSCDATMPLDANSVQRGCRNHQVTTAVQLCGTELERFRSLSGEETPLTVGCTQEAALFKQVASESGRGNPINFTNIRETAGWSSEAAAAGPKMAALLAAAQEPVPAAPMVSLESGGVILIYGRDETAVEAGNLLKDHLDVTVMITPPAELAPRAVDFPVAKGRVRNARGHLGAFEVVGGAFTFGLVFG